jgi:hypothetical protein
MSLWTGGKAVILGVNPYDVDVWQPLRAAYGSNWMPDQTSPYPLWTHILFVPLSFLTTRMAAAIWMTFCELSLILAPFLVVQEFDWEGYLLFPLLAGVVFYRPVIPAITNGQVSPVLLLILVGSYSLYKNGHPFAAGLLLTLETIKPNATAILLFTAVLVFVMHRRWSSLTGLIVGGTSLTLISWIILPGWPLQWIATASKSSKSQLTCMTPSLWGLAYDLGGAQLWPGSAIAAGTILYLALLYSLWKQRGVEWGFGLSLAVIASVFLTPYLWAYEHVVLLFPNTIALCWGLDSKVGSRWFWWGGWAASTVVSSWLLFFVALQRNVDTWSSLMPLIALTYLLLAWQARKRSVSSQETPSEPMEASKGAR